MCIDVEPLLVNEVPSYVLMIITVLVFILSHFNCSESFFVIVRWPFSISIAGHHWGW
jgi:hypothetical protein